MTFKSLILFTLLMLAGVAIPQSASAKTYLVAVGIADYPGKAHDLMLPTHDADTIEWLYRRNTNAITAKLLNSQATRANIIRTMERVYSQASPDDNVILFFSGHGYKGGFVAHDGLLSYQQIRRAMSKSRSKHKMIFADACFSGRLRSNKQSNRTSNTETTATKQADVLLFLSSRDNEISFERRGMANGFFTRYLQLGLRGKADTNGDRIVTASELFDYVSASVQQASGKAQHPVMWGKFPHDMPLMKW